MLEIKNNDKILIIRSAGIGDFLVILPFINYLKNIKKVPKENIYFLTISNNELNPIKLFFKDEIDYENSEIFTKKSNFKDLLLIRKKNKKRNINKVIYLPFVNETFSSKIKKMLFSKIVSGFNKKIYGFNIFKKHKNSYNTQYLTYFEQLEVNNIENKLLFSVNDLFKFTTNEYRKIEDFKLDKSKINVCLYINSKLKMKIWNRNNYHDVVKYLKEKYSANIFLIGGNDDVNYNNNFINESDYEIINLAGQFTFRETFLLFDKFDLLVGNDGAPLHLAAFTKIAILGIYTYKEEVMSWEPYKSNRFITIRKNVTCKHCYMASCKNTICLDSLSFNDIVSYMDLLLSCEKIKQSVVIF